MPHQGIVALAFILLTMRTVHVTNQEFYREQEHSTLHRYNRYSD